MLHFLNVTDCVYTKKKEKSMMLTGYFCPTRWPATSFKSVTLKSQSIQLLDSDWGFLTAGSDGMGSHHCWDL